MLFRKLLVIGVQAPEIVPGHGRIVPHDSPLGGGQ
jgi:hypothetical protein